MNDAKLKEIIWKSKNDFYFFCKEILGFSDLRKQPHQELGELLINGKKRKKLILMPRGSFKSTVVTAGYVLWSIVKNPNVRILISSETQRNSIKYVKEIKSHLESNQKLRQIFGDFSSGENTWRDNEFIVSKRTFPKKEPTVMASSLEKQAIVGLHFDIIILDDVVSRNNINTKDQIQKTIDHYRLLLSVLDPGSDKRLVMVGTRWSWVDLYGWIIEGDEKDQFDIFVRQAIQHDGSLLLPDRLTKEFLEEQRKTQGEFIYNCQYMNQAVAGDTATFRPDHIQYYDKLEKTTYNFVSIDPAISTKTSADFSGITVIGVDCEENWYVREALNLKLDPSGLIDKLFELNAQYQPMAFIMERFALEKSLKHALTFEMEKRNAYFPIRDIPTDTRKSKEARIAGLQPKFESKKIFLKRNHEDLVHQIVHHPQLKNDDLLDSLKNFLSPESAVCAPDIDVDKPKNRYETQKDLTPTEVRLWENVDKVAKLRSVRRTKWSI